MTGFFEDTEEDFIEQVYKPVQRKKPTVFDNVRNIPDQIEFDENSGNLVITPCQCQMDSESMAYFAIGINVLSQSLCIHCVKLDRTTLRCGKKESVQCKICIKNK